MEALNYKLEQFEGPLDLLIDLVAKNKVDLNDIPISLICDQYLDYIAEAERLDMELASEFLTMASYLILIKSKMLLPQKEKEQEDPRENLAFVIAEHVRSQKLALILRERYAQFGGRWQKDTDEISPDRSFVLEQDAEKLYEAARRVLAYQRTEKSEPIEKITPIIKKKIIPVEEKIVGILTHFKKKKKNSLKSVLSDAKSRPELIAIFIGVLELIKQRRIIIVESPEEFTSLHGMNTVFEFNENYSSEGAKEAPSSEYN